MERHNGEADIDGGHQAGLRRHRGEVIGNGAWPAIFTRAEHERLLAALNDRDTPTIARSSLLTGLVVCGHCGSAMTRNGNQRNGSRGRVGTWRCAKRPGYPNCGQMSITARPLENLIGEAVMVALEGPSLAGVLAGASDGREDDTAVAELADVETRLMGLARRSQKATSGLSGCGRAGARPESDGCPCLAPAPGAFCGPGLLRSPRCAA